jgi:hypothetical protein
MAASALMVWLTFAQGKISDQFCRLDRALDGWMEAKRIKQ